MMQSHGVSFSNARNNSTLTEAPKAQHRIVGLDYLRGVAALFVVYGHVVVMGATDFVTTRLYFPFIPHTPIDEASVPGIHHYLGPEIVLNNLGMSTGWIGVSLFFILSGFVIIPSLESLGPRRFLIHRFFRIFPTLAATCIGATLVFSSRYNVPIYGWSNTLASVFLVSGLAGRETVTPVLWTLIIEVWFYLLIAITLSMRGRLDNVTVCGTGVFCGGVAALFCLSAKALEGGTLTAIAWHVALNFTFIIHILIGSAVYNYWRTPSSRLSCAGLIWGLIALFFVLSVSMRSVCAGFPDYRIQNVLIGLTIFTVVLGLEKVVPRLFVAGFFAKISYPLYLVHVPLAWLIMFKLQLYGVHPHLNIFLTVGICVLLAWMLHVAVENPGIGMGKFLTRNLPTRNPNRSRPFW